MFFATIVGAAQYAYHGDVDFSLAIQFAISGAIGAALGAKLASYVKGSLLKKLFAILLILVAVQLFYKTWFGITHAGAYAWMHGWEGIAIESGIGLAAGTIGGFFGVGGGIIIVPMLVLLLGLPQKTAQGVSLCAIPFVSLSATIMNLRLGNVDKAIVLNLVPAAIAGNILGSQLAHIASGNVLGTIFSALLVVTGIVMVVRKPSPSR